MIKMENGKSLGYDEVVDTLEDALVVVEKIHTAVRDGIGLGDIGTVIEITPRLNEIRQDADEFAAEFTDLDPSESAAVARELVARRGGSTDDIVQKALSGLTLASRWHDVGATLSVLVEDTIDYGKDLFKKAT